MPPALTSQANKTKGSKRVADIVIAQQRNFQLFPQSLIPVSDLLLAGGIGIAATVVLGIFGSVKVLKPFAEFVPTQAAQQRMPWRSMQLKRDDVKS